MLTREALDGLDRGELERGRARYRHIEFMRYTWQRPDPMIEAKQTPFQRIICGRIDNAMQRYRNGLSTFLCVNLCFGHGKSDVSSRYLPPHFLGEFPDSEVLVVSHTDDKANEFGEFSRNLFQSSQYRHLYPRMQLSESNRGVQEWGVHNHFGKAQFIGIGAGTAGKRGNLIVVDDFFGKREHAESADLREKTWTRFTEDVMSRRAPVSIVLLVVTPWHVDDPVGRLKKEMKKDPDFPQFEVISFPAEDKERKMYPSGWLFPERFSPAWYESQKKFLGEYGYRSLMQCDPQTRVGSMIRVDKVQIVDEMPDDVQFFRGWDLASSEKQLTKKSDPDFTVGVLAGVRQVPTAVPGLTIPIVYVADVVRGQWEATQRNKIILDTAIADGDEVVIGIEAFGAYKDTYTIVANILQGTRVVHKMQMPGDKIAKASPLVPIFESGNIFIKKAPWNESFVEIIRSFPSGDHDDDVDALSVAFDMANKNQQVVF